MNQKYYILQTFSNLLLCLFIIFIFSFCLLQPGTIETKVATLIRKVRIGYH